MRAAAEDLSSTGTVDEEKVKKYDILICSQLWFSRLYKISFYTVQNNFSSYLNADYAVKRYLLNNKHSPR